jgi:hypothetical protein
MWQNATLNSCLSYPAYPLIHYSLGETSRGGWMKMKFTLNMENLEVNGRAIDTMILDWIDEVSQDQVLQMSQQWISSQTFLTDRMTGLHRVGESSLTIEPVSE